MITASLRPHVVALQRFAVSPQIGNILRTSVQHSFLINIIAQLEADSLQQLAHLNFYEQAP